MPAPIQPPAGRQPAAVPAARACEVTRIYGRGPAAVTALDAVSVDIPADSFVAVMGPSGSGKSTLMHCMAGLDAVTSGRIWIGDTELSFLRERQLTRLRRDRVGFVFRAYNLPPVLSDESGQAGETVSHVRVLTAPQFPHRRAQARLAGRRRGRSGRPRRSTCTALRWYRPGPGRASPC